MAESHVCQLGYLGTDIATTQGLQERSQGIKGKVGFDVFISEKVDGYPKTLCELLSLPL